MSNINNNMTNNLHGEVHHEDHSHGTYKSYIVGFLMSIILTLGSYFIVTSGVFPASATYIVISLLGILQLLVQLIFFLHLASEKGPRLNLLTFIFTVIITVILVGGSLWVMYNMNANMM